MGGRSPAPFQYPGSKFRVADIVWRRLGGDVSRYIEPFAGSLGVLLGRPGDRDGAGEVINDADGFIVNVWRAIRHASAEVAYWLEGPSTTADLNSRHQWIHSEGRERVAGVFTDPEHYDAQSAAWFVYGLDFAAHPRAFMNPTCQPGRASWNSAKGHAADWRQPLNQHLAHLARRLNRALILAGDWTEALTPAVLNSVGNGRLNSDVGVFLDPPYSGTLRQADLYGSDSGEVAADVLAWCREWGAHPQLRICLAGYVGEHDVLEDDGWGCAAWSSVSGGDSRHDERLWFSPHCLKDDQLSLFRDAPEPPQ